MGKRLAARVDKIDDDRWKGSTLACLRYLAKHAEDKTGIVRGIGLSEIAAWLQLSWDRAKRIMQTLRKSGVIEIIQRGGGRTHTNVYRLHIPRPGAA